MNRKPKQFDDDDGRVVVDMDVDGIRQHDKRVRKEQRALRKAARGDQMTRSEARRYNSYALLAALTIGLVFTITWVLFVLFCIYVWFR